MVSLVGSWYIVQFMPASYFFAPVSLKSWAIPIFYMSASQIMSALLKATTDIIF